MAREEGRAVSPGFTSRREILLGLARAAALGGLALLGGKLLARSSGSSDPAAHTCQGDGVCRSCGTLQACLLPQALSARDRLGGGA